MASPGELMAKAVERTGLDDFGDDSFREGLEILVKALNDEARLNARGEGFVYGRIGNHLRQRLQVEDWYRRHPEIDDVPIDSAAVRARPAPHRVRPHCRSCSRRIRDVRYLRSWESGAAVPAAVDGARRRTRAFRRSYGSIVGSRHHVPTDVHGPMECLDLMALDFKSQIFQAFGADPVVLRMVRRQGGFHVDLPLRASGPQAARSGVSRPGRGG